MNLSYALKKNSKFYFLLVLITVFLTILILYFLQKETILTSKIDQLNNSESKLKSELVNVKKQFTEFKNQDQVKRNDKLEKDIKNIETTYKKAVTTYEKLLDLKTQTQKTTAFNQLFTKALTLLSQLNYASSEATLITLSKNIDDEKQKIASSFVIPSNVPVNNAPPSAGYSRQQVQADIGTYLVDIVSADLGNTKVIVDTASDSTCSDGCPTLPLSEYVSRNGAFAGINGSYFCPAEYPSCAGKTNSFDTLLMNKNKVYFNSDNNVYSTVPAVIFLGTSVRYVGQSLEWGRDTGVDGVIANQPLLLSGGNIAFGGDGDPKKGSKGSRSFVGSKGSTVYIGIVRNATVAEVAHVLKTMGLENALNLDSGGSTALWSGGYKAGPGRNLPNAVLFVRK